MNFYSRSLDVARLQCEARRAARFRKMVRARSRWGDPLLAGVLLASAAWAITEIHVARAPGEIPAGLQQRPEPPLIWHTPE